LKRVVRAHDLRGIDRHGGCPERAEGAGEQVDAHALAERRDCIERAGRGVPEHCQRIAQHRELRQAPVDRVEHGGALTAGESQLGGRRMMFGA
jgi:hypothetical protein